jgi:hypothetical protein
MSAGFNEIPMLVTPHEKKTDPKINYFSIALSSNIPTQYFRDQYGATESGVDQANQSSFEQTTRNS